MMMKKLCLILALIAVLCSCACGETLALTAGEISGLWELEYVTSAGFMVQAQAYGLSVTLNLAEDGSADMDFNGEPGDAMQWYILNGRAYISGYNPDEDVEILINDIGVLEITDEIGSMFFTRPGF